jgi:DNA-binding NtrC family response regulator
LAQREYITPAELELEFVKSGAPKFKIEKAHLEERLISQTLAKYHGNITQTASALGMSRRNLRYLLAKYKIDKAQFKGR